GRWVCGGAEGAGRDGVGVSGAGGAPVPATLKVALNYLGGYRNTMTFVLTGLDVEAKARLAEETLRRRLGGSTGVASLEATLVRAPRPPPPTHHAARPLPRPPPKDAPPP